MFVLPYFARGSPRGGWLYVKVHEADNSAGRDSHSSTRPHASSPPPKHYIRGTSLLLVKWCIAQISCYRETVCFISLLISLKTELEINSPFPVPGVSGAQTTHDTKAGLPVMTPGSGSARAGFSQFCICSNNLWHCSADVQGANTATSVWALLSWTQRCANAAVTVSLCEHLPGATVCLNWRVLPKIAVW